MSENVKNRPALQRLLFLLLLLLPLATATAQAPSDDAGRARVLFDLNRYADAAALLEKIEQRGNPTATDLILLGLCYTELKELDKAAVVLDKAAILAPSSIALIDAKGNLAFARRQYADAVQLFRKARLLDPQDKNALAGLVASLSNYGVELYSRGSVPEARAALLEAIQLDPQSAPALRNMGILEMEKGDIAVAAGYFERALVVSPQDVQSLRLLFLIRNRQGDTAAMESLLDRLIAAQPADPEPYAAKARLMEQQGKSHEAADLFAQAVDRGTQDPLPYLRVGQAKRNRFTLHDAIGKAVQLISALQIQATQAVGRAQNPDDLRGARLLTTQVEDVRQTLGTALSLLREIDGDVTFEQDLTRLQGWYPGSVDLTAALGRLYQEKGRWQESLAAWQRILADRPLNVEAQAGAGLAFEKLGNSQEAETAYRRARDLEPEAPEIYAALERVFADHKADLRQMLLDVSYRETRNLVLLQELVTLEDALGLTSDAAAHRARIAQINAGQ